MLTKLEMTAEETVNQLSAYVWEQVYQRLPVWRQIAHPIAAQVRPTAFLTVEEIIEGF